MTDDALDLMSKDLLDAVEREIGVLWIQTYWCVLHTNTLLPVL